MGAHRVGRVLGGTAALVAGSVAAGWAAATLLTYWRFVSGLGSFESRFAWRSLTFGIVEIAVAAGLIALAIRCFGSKPLRPSPAGSAVSP